MNYVLFFEAHWCSLRIDRTIQLGMSLVATALLCLFGTLRAEDSLRIGVSEIDITPPDYPMAGYYHERLAQGTIDPLKAKAIVFAQGDTIAAMVVCDLTGISRDLCESVRRKASKATGIPPQAISISATHSHTAPDYSKHLYEFLKDHKHEKKEIVAPDASTLYERELLDGIVKSIVDAHGKLEPVSLASGSATQQIPVAFNRRFVMKDGSVQTWKNMADPNVVRAAGPIDPEIGIVVIRSSTGTLQAVLSNFALHLDTVGGLRWSADYPYFIEQTLRNTWGDNVVSIFGTGCCGDINHSNPQSTIRNKTDFIGKTIASTIDAAIPTLRTLQNTTLQARSMTVNLPLQPLKKEELERATQVLTVIKGGGKVDFLEQVHAYKTLMLGQFRGSSPSGKAEELLTWGLSHSWFNIGDSLPVDIQTITVGDELAIVFLPGEVFVELGLSIKQGSPFRTTLIVELSNCVETAYIPTRAAYAGGSYEVTNSTVEPGAGEMLVEAALRLLRQSATSITAPR